MKKLFTFIAAVFMAANAMAVTDIIDFEQTSFTSLAFKSSCVKETFNADGTVTLSNEQFQTNNYDYQYWVNANIALTAGEIYTVTLEAKFDGRWMGVRDNNLACRLGDWDNGETKYFRPETDGEYHTISAKFIAGSPTYGNGILLQHGNFVGTVTLKKITISHTPKPAGTKKALQITMTAAKTEKYEAQAFISLPQDQLTAGEAYNVKMRVKASSAFEMGSQAMDDKQSAHKNQYDNSAVYNYTADKNVTTEFTDFVINCPGVTNLTDCNAEKSGHEVGGDDHKNFAYAPSAILLNHGKLAEGGVLTISDIQLFDKDWNFITNIDLASVAAYDNTKSVYYPAWQKAATYEITYLPQEEVTIDEALTYSSDKILNFSELTNVEAYIATAIGDKKVTMTKVTGAVPAGTGLVLKQVGEATTVLIPSCATPTDDVSTNLLVATTTETTPPVGSYVLAGTSETLGWYRIGNVQPTLAAGKAYLSVPAPVTSAKSLNIVWGEDSETTGIATISTEQTINGAAYNLAGQRVNANAKGLVIMNGKKLFNK